MALSENFNGDQSEQRESKLESLPLLSHQDNEKKERKDKQTWPVDNPCKLIVSSVEPTLDNINTNAAYVFYTHMSDDKKELKSSVYYVNKKTKERIKLDLDEKTRILLTEAMKLSHPHRLDRDGTCQLSEKELNKIFLLTGHHHLPLRDTPPKCSEWQEKYGCDLIISDEAPTAKKLNEFRKKFHITNAAYVRCKDKLDDALYYVTPLEVYRLSEKSKGRLARLDQVLKTDSSQHRKLADKELTQIKEITNHSHITPWQKVLSDFGLLCSAIMAVGCGVSTAGTFISMNIATGGLASVIAAMLFVSGTAVNWWIFKRYVSPVLIALFGREKFMVDENNNPLEISQIVMLGIAIALATSVGITFAALTFTSTFDLVLAFPFLTAIGPALPYVAGLLAGVTLICMTALMLKDLADLIKAGNIIQNCKNFLTNLFSANPNAIENKGKSPTRVKWERNFRVTLSFLFIPLACIGLFMTMSACAPGVKEILLHNIPLISARVADGLAKFISLGLAFAGQIPFGITTAFETLASISKTIFGTGSQEVKSVVREKPISTGEKIWNRIRLAAVFSNASGNGGISAKGAGANNPGLATLAFVCGTATSAFAGIPAVTAKSKLMKPLLNNPPMRDDTYINPTEPGHAKPATRPDFFAPHSDRPIKPIRLVTFLNEPKAKVEAKEEKGKPRTPRLFSSDDMSQHLAKPAYQKSLAPSA